MKTPPLLHRGSTVAIVSPAGIARPQQVFEAAGVMERLWGWNVRVMPHALGRHGTFSGSIDERLADFLAAWTDDTVDALICSRGGYGAVQLLDSLQHQLPVASTPKWLVGFSDITALHGLMHRNGIASIHGPMCKHISENGGDNLNACALQQMLTKGRIDYQFRPHPLNRCGSATAPLIGGNLSVMAALIDTPYSLIRPGTILFIEDLNEPIYKLQRILYQLRLNGTLSQLAALVVGQFVNCPADPNYPSVETMIAEMVAPYDYPVAMGIPIGHGGHALPFYESAYASLSVTSEMVTFAQRL